MAMKLVRIRSVEPQADFRVRLVLTDGRSVERDLSDLLIGRVFEAVRNDPGMFRSVEVRGGTLVWPNGADLCPDVVIWGGPPPAEAALSNAQP